MDLEGITLNEISQRKIPYDLTYIWNLQQKQNKLRYREQIRLMVARGRRVGGGCVGSKGRDLELSGESVLGTQQHGSCP